MKKILVSVFVTLLVMTTAYSASLLSIVDAAKTVNSNYKLYELSMEKTQLDYDKAMIEATNKKAELSAKSSKASGDNSTQNNLSSFYSEILNDIFDIKSKEITCQTNELTVKIAEIDANDKENLFKKGLVSENDLKDASLTLKEAKSDLEQAKEDLELSLNNYKKDTSLEWEDMDLFVPEYEALLISDDEWLEVSLSVLTSEYSLEQSKYDIQNLSLNSSLYDKKIADISLEQSEIDLELSKETALNQKDTYEDGLYYTYKQLQTSIERVNIAQDELDDVIERYNKGLVSETDFYTQKKQYLSTVSQYDSSLKSYWTTLSSYLISTNSDVESFVRETVKTMETKEEE